MGDSGSLFLGFVLASFAVALAESPEPTMPPMTAVWILAVPITDTLASMLRRAVRGRSPFHADREHLHHVLMAAGYSDRQAVALLLFASMLCGAFGIGAWRLGVPEYAMFYAYVGLLTLHFFAMMHAWRLVRLIGHGPRRHEVVFPVPASAVADPGAGRERILKLPRPLARAGRERPGRRQSPSPQKGRKAVPAEGPPEGVAKSGDRV
jgi:hypothetical protein